MKKILLLFTVLLFLNPVVNTTILNVPGSYATIQAAINASVNGDTVLVAAGTYMENINFRGKRIVVTSLYYTTNNPATISATVINGSTPVNPDTGSCVIISSGEDSTTVLQGFTLTGGTGTKWNDEHAAGLYREGGGLLTALSSPIIQNNIIYNNIVTNVSGVNSTGGGGIRSGDGYPKFYNNVIYGNTARYGAGVVLNYTGCQMKNNIITSNYGSFQFGGGSGVWINNNFSRSKLLENNTIVYNTATGGVGGIYIFSGSATLRNNVVWGNTPGNQILGGSASVSYCNIQGGFIGAGNINSNPLFTDSSYVLMPNSPCVDKGDSSTIYDDPPDPNNPSYAKYPARGTIRNDMGAYGGPLSKILSSTVIGIEPISNEIPAGFALEQNYPNPFNPVTKLKFKIADFGFVQLKIIDILGRETAILVNEQLQPGIYEIDFNASGFASGVYFYKLISGNFSATKKMIISK